MKSFLRLLLAVVAVATASLTLKAQSLDTSYDMQTPAADETIVLPENAEEADSVITADNSQLVYKTFGEDTSFREAVTNNENRTATVFNNIGKSFMYAGAGMAITGVITLLGYSAMNTVYPDRPFQLLYPIVTLYQWTLGASVALIGLCCYIPAIIVCKATGVSQFKFGNDETRGFTGIVDLQLAIPESVGITAVAGYNFNNWIFLGAGTGYRLWLSDSYVEEGDNAISSTVPVFANARFSFGKQTVVPFIGLSLGYEFLHNGLYTGVELGARVKVRNGSRGVSWWIGNSTEFVGHDYQFVSLKVGRSF